MLNVNAIINDTERMLRRLIGEDIEFVTALDPLVGQIMADPGQIHQVIMNLVVNARDAMPNGGKLEIRRKMSMSMRVLRPCMVAEFRASMS